MWQVGRGCAGLLTTFQQRVLMLSCFIQEERATSHPRAEEAQPPQLAELPSAPFNTPSWNLGEEDLLGLLQRHGRQVPAASRLEGWLAFRTHARVYQDH